MLFIIFLSFLQVDYLSNFIVRNVSDPASKSVRSVLSNILANNVAELYNLDGGGSDGKELFRKLKIYEIVKGYLKNKDI